MLDNISDMQGYFIKKYLSQPKIVCWSCLSCFKLVLVISLVFQPETSLVTLGWFKLFCFSGGLLVCQDKQVITKNKLLTSYPSASVLLQENVCLLCRM